MLAGGVGAARFLAGLTRVVEPSTITAIVNTADDAVMHGLYVSPDLDTVTYTLATAIDPTRGWGLAGETWRTMDALSRYTAVRPDGSNAGGTWFSLGDTDLATHLYRSGRLAEGATLTEVADEIRLAWGLDVRIVPMTDAAVRTMVRLADGREVGFQEYFVGLRHEPAISGVRFDGVDVARPAFLGHLRDAELVVIAPSNPFVSIGPIRALPGVDELLASRRERVVAVSPIVGGSALKGPAAGMLQDLGHERSALGVARMYASICGTIVVDEADAALSTAIEAEGLRCIVTNTIMDSPDAAEALARVTIGVR